MSSKRGSQNDFQDLLVSVIGARGTGKSAIINSFLRKPFNKKWIRNVSSDLYKANEIVEINEKPRSISLTIIDEPGYEIIPETSFRSRIGSPFKTSARFESVSEYIKKVNSNKPQILGPGFENKLPDAYIVVYSDDVQGSLTMANEMILKLFYIRMWKNITESENSIELGINNIPCILVRNKTDMESVHDPDSIPNINCVRTSDKYIPEIMVSAKSGSGIESVFSRISQNSYNFYYSSVRFINQFQIPKSPSYRNLQEIEFQINEIQSGNIDEKKEKLLIRLIRKARKHFQRF